MKSKPKIKENTMTAIHIRKTTVIRLQILKAIRGAPLYDEVLNYLLDKEELEMGKR